MCDNAKYNHILSQLIEMHSEISKIAKETGTGFRELRMAFVEFLMKGKK